MKMPIWSRSGTLKSRVIKVRFGRAWSIVTAIRQFLGEPGDQRGAILRRQPAGQGEGLAERGLTGDAHSDLLRSALWSGVHSTPPRVDLPYDRRRQRLGLAVAPGMERAEAQQHTICLQHALPGADAAPVDHHNRVEDAVAAWDDQVVVCHEQLVKGRQQECAGLVAAARCGRLGVVVALPVEVRVGQLSGDRAVHAAVYAFVHAYRVRCLRKASFLGIV